MFEISEFPHVVHSEPDSHDSGDAFVRDVLAGLDRMPRSIPPRYFYDAAGSALFDRICELPEYYPTRAELGILTDNAREIGAWIGPRADLIEFGAGSLTKVRCLLDAFTEADRPRRYLPIDISGAHLEQAAQRLRTDYPGLTVQPVVADYMAPFAIPDSIGMQVRRVGFFPGSTIGNFSHEEAMTFLRRAAQLLRGGGLIVGVDLVKAPATLHAAYNDAQGVTAAFNLNLLRRINREARANFDPDGFGHHALYDPVSRRIEMHLASRRDQTVTLAGRTHRFQEGETLHTENSQKFTIEGFRNLALEAGFHPRHVWTDASRLFSVHWLEAPAR